MTASRILRAGIAALTALTALSALAALSACRDAPTTAASSSARVAVSASVAGTTVASLVARVTAPDMQPTAVNLALDLATGVASGTIAVPAGSERTLTLEAFDVHGVLTHRGERVLTVAPGTNPSVAVTLVPLAGDVPIVATVGSTAIAIAGAVPSLAIGDTMRLAATITYADGARPAGGVRWSATPYGRAWIDSLTGRFVAIDTGAVDVYATYAGASASVRVVIAAGGTWASVSTAIDFGCGVRLDGAGFCWGRNNFGQLGAGSAADLSVAAVPVAGGYRFSAIYTAYRGACGLTTDGRAVCWGHDRYGRAGVPAATVVTRCIEAYTYIDLGVTRTRSDTLPCLRAPVEVATGERFVSLAAGDQATCGLTAAGAAYCWGVPWEVGTAGIPDTVGVGPTRVGGYTFVQLVRGQSQTCGRTPDGRLFCWGGNWEGQLGDDSYTFRPAPVAVQTSVRFRDVSAGRGPTTCGVAVDGDAYCWGDAGLGILGAGIIDTTNRRVPVKVQSPVAFQRIYVGSENACAETVTGSLYCWGSGGIGQIGNGDDGLADVCMVPWDPTFTRPCASTPVRVPRLYVTPGTVSGGQAATCAIERRGTAVCWGGNWYGKLGDGTTQTRTIPTKVQNAP